MVAYNKMAETNQLSGCGLVLVPRCAVHILGNWLMADKRTTATNDQEIDMHSEHLVNTNDSKSLTDIGLVFLKKDYCCQTAALFGNMYQIA